MGFIRWLLTLVVMGFLAYLFVAFIGDGYLGSNIFPDQLEPDAWAAPDSWSEWRDIAIVFTAIFWIVALILLSAVFAALVYLIFTLRKILRENAVPAIDSLKGVLDNAQGTAEFAGETVASPIIRVYSIVTGVRKGVGAFTNFPGRVRQRRGKK
ncbi:MAG TPA: hypothetical protein VFY90_02480 [Tepidiformaceae bacterium]|nr:hypothetical protein [Tepidiformaceae bacterium]